MRNFTLLFALLLIWGFSSAQDTIRVSPDYTNGGALNKAIAANGPNKVYLLEVNGFYTLTSTIEFLRPEGDPDAYYHIVGEIPKSADDYMPVLQTGLTAENTPFQRMFTIKADVSFKNIFIVNQTTTGELGEYNMYVEDKVNLVVDGCMVDPIGRVSFIHGNGLLSTGTNMYVTNNTLLRQGDEFSPNGGHVFWGVFADTMYIENNSIISTDNNVIAGEEFVYNIKFLWFNHNTVAFHDVRLIEDRFLPGAYITNNLFYDLSTYVQQHGWAAIDPEHGSTGTYPVLATAARATIDGELEPLPSARTHLWNRNALYVSDAVQDEILGIAANNPDENQLWQFPVLWNEDVPHYFVTDWDEKGAAILANSRETKMFGSTDYPNFVEDNTWYDMNPNFVDPRIEEHSKDVASSALFWYRLNKLLGGENPDTQKSQFWDVDGWAGTSAAMYPTVWPRWNGAYTNEAFLNASTAGLPLGDLNAFPEQKAKWEAEKEGIMEHILSLNTGRYILTDVNETSIGVQESFRMYPNPVKDAVTIESKSVMKSLKIYNITGQLMLTKEINYTKINLDLSGLVKGVYVVEAEYKEGGRLTSKLIKK